MCEKTRDAVGGQEKTDEKNNGRSRVLKGDWVNYVRSGKRQEGRKDGITQESLISQCDLDSNNIICLFNSTHNKVLFI